jgi:hypothetical protein
MTDSKAYTGGCHCKQNRYEVTFSYPLDNENNKVVNCNCSICSTNGYLLAFTNLSDVKWEHGGIDNLKQYNFGKGMLNHFFCTNCGTSVGATGSMGGAEQIGINVSTWQRLMVRS